MSSAHGEPCFPRQAGELHKNDYIVMKEVYPCKVTEISTSKTGKHGHAKCSITAVDIFTGRKYEDSCPSTHNVMVPFVTKTDFPLLDMDDEYATYRDADDIEQSVQLPTENAELVKNLRAALNAGNGDVYINIQAAMGFTAIVDFRVDSSAAK